MKKSEDPKKFFDLLEKSIINVISIENTILDSTKLKLLEFKNKFSNLDKPSLCLFYDNSQLNRNKYKVHYKCLCGNEPTIHLKKFLNKQSLVCSKCRENEEKRKRHSEILLSKNFNKKLKGNFFNCDLTTLIENSENEFKLENETFLKKYFEKNITNLEFESLKKNIVKINNVDIKDKNIKFIVALKVNNQSKYSQYIIIDNIKVHLSNIQYKCENCCNVFNTTRRPKKKINNLKIMCSKCSFCNKTFKIRNYVTKFGDIITYQSKLEHNFILMCEKLNIKILNGFTIDYIFKNKNHKYRIDFFLPEHKLLVELKSNHIWHRTQLNSGVWFVKQTTTEKYSSENNLTYKLLFQEDLENFFNLLRYSLDYDENHRN